MPVYIIVSAVILLLIMFHNVENCGRMNMRGNESIMVIVHVLNYIYSNYKFTIYLLTC